MTKTQMILEIQVAEAKAWKQYRSAQKDGGYDEAHVDRLRSKWSGIFDLRERLGIAPLATRELEKLGLLATLA
jgi:hypothetical protein